MRRELDDGLHTRISALTRQDDLLGYASRSSGIGDEQEPFDRAVETTTGEERWVMDRSGHFVTGLIVHGDRLFLAETFDTTVDDPSTRELSTEATEHKSNTALGLSGTGLFYGNDAGYVSVYDRDTDEQRWEERVDGVVNHEPIVADGIGWIASGRGTLSATGEPARLASERMSSPTSSSISRTACCWTLGGIPIREPTNVVELRGLIPAAPNGRTREAEASGRRRDENHKYDFPRWRPPESWPRRRR